MEFRWNDWNLEHAQKHGVEAEESEEVIERAKPPWPDPREENKWVVWGQTAVGRYVQVAYVIDADGTMYIIHARPLNEKEKSGFRRRARR